MNISALLNKIKVARYEKRKSPCSKKVREDLIVESEVMFSGCLTATPCHPLQPPLYIFRRAPMGPNATNAMKKLEKFVEEIVE